MPRSFPPFRCGLAAALSILLLPISSRAEAPRVVASIKPIHSLVAAVMAGIGTPSLIVRGAASEHGYQLRPSDAKTLSEAQLVFWVGPVLENYLQQPLASLAGRAKLVALAAAPGVTLLPARGGGNWEPDEDDAPSTPDAVAADPHFWLDPMNAVAILREAERQLAAIDPADAPRFADNEAAEERRLNALDAELQRRLAALRQIRFVVFHDAYQYFERRYHLAAIGSVTVDPEHQPGARRIGEVHDKIVSLGATCVFTEPQFEPGIVRTIIAGTRVRMGTLDPVGAMLPEGPGLYPALLEQLAEDLVHCLTATDEAAPEESKG